ncbi:MAG: hypothetical protein KF729_23970 [Sandaracinaceae bacterium]|nr:hypothetical protein [Sandaracinaceae bacterium]
MSRGLVAISGRERRLLVERVGLFVDTLERAAVAREHLEERGVGRRRDLGHLLAATSPGSAPCTRFAWTLLECF